MALIVAMGPPKKGNKMKKKEEIMLEDEDMSSDMDDMESEYDDLDEDMEGLEGEEDSLFDMEESDDSDLEMLVEDVMSAFEAKDSKQLMNALKDFIRSVMDKE